MRFVVAPPAPDAAAAASASSIVPPQPTAETAATPRPSHAVNRMKPSERRIRRARSGHSRAAGAPVSRTLDYDAAMVDEADPDAELVARFRAGDRAAFDVLAGRHRDAVLRLVRRYVKRDADAADVAQKALLRAFEKIDGFRGEAIVPHVALPASRSTRR